MPESGSTRSPGGLRSHCQPRTNTLIKCRVDAVGDQHRASRQAVCVRSRHASPAGSLYPLGHTRPLLPSWRCKACLGVAWPPGTRRGPALSSPHPHSPFNPQRPASLPPPNSLWRRQGPITQTENPRLRETNDPFPVPVNITSSLSHCLAPSAVALETGASAGCQWTLQDPKQHNCTKESKNSPASSHVLRTRIKFIIVTPAPSSVSPPSIAYLGPHTSCGPS